MRDLEEKLGYRFRNPELLRTALTHSSYANEKRRPEVVCNERLEFLGDAILGFVVADFLYRSFPERPEGEMTRLRADLVCEGNLARCAGTIGLALAITLRRFGVSSVTIYELPAEEAKHGFELLTTPTDAVKVMYSFE